MKMLDANLNEVNVDVRESRYPPRETSRSGLQGVVGSILRELYPLDSILEDFVIPGSKLSVDFFIPVAGIVIEVQGRQHSEYVSFFHGEKSKLGFAHQVNRDSIKRAWVDANGFKFIELDNHGKHNRREIQERLSRSCRSTGQDQ